MPEKIAFDLVSPDRLLVSTEADMVVVPGSEGYFGAMRGHQPLISSLRTGIVTVVDDGKETARYFVRGGFAEVTHERCTVLAEQAIPLAELDRPALEQRLKDAEEDLADAKSDNDREKADQTIRQLKELLDAVS